MNSKPSKSAISPNLSRITSGIVFAALCLATAASAASPPGDVVGKVTVGYQGWFACTGDNAPIGTWWHYSGGTTPPTTVTLTNSIHAWPDMRQFRTGYQTGFANFSNGQPATLFSSYDDQVVQTHFRWMAENGIDTAALQRFNPTGGEGPTRNAITLKVMNAAQIYGVKFYIMYDISGWTTFATDITNDWINVVGAQLHVTNSPMYAMQNGKPVVCIWGMGFNDSNHPFDAPTCLTAINWFKSQGCYVIGGVPTHWLAQTSDSRSNFLSAYSAFNMISPWMVGRIGNSGDSDNFRTSVNQPDVAYCKSNNIDYQPCVLPGDTGQRAHGNFMWHQFGNMIQVGAQGIYISMFDEFNEGNQIACTAEDASMIPVGSSNLYFTLNQDGTACSSDYYLRLTGDGDKMLKGIIPFTFTKPTAPTLPLVLPAVPAGLTADGGNSLVTLSWLASPGAASYNLKRSLASGGPYATITTNIGLVGCVDAGLTNGTTYYYVVSAVNKKGETLNSTQISGTPFATVASASNQNAPTEGAAQAFDGQTSTKWYDNGTPPPVWLRAYFGGIAKTVVGYDLTSASDVQSRDPKNWQFQGSQNGTTWTTLDTQTGQVFPVRLQTVEYAITNNTAWQYYRLNVTANSGGSGFGVQLAEMAFTYNDGTLPATPTNLVVAAVGSGQATLSWMAGTGASGYNLKRATTSGGSYTNVTANLASLIFTNTGLANGTMYYYVVSATNATGESPNSGEISVRPTSSAALQLSFQTSDGQIQFNWPMDHMGWQLQVQTNSTGAELGTNWVTVSGSTNTNQISIPVSSLNGSTFFRLVNSVNP